MNNSNTSIDLNSNFVKGENIYRQINRKRQIIFFIVLTSLITLLLVDLMVGPAWLKIGDVINALKLGPKGDTMNSAIVWSVRLPMTATCLCVGAGLGLAGTQMQTILANPLASPYTLGISSAAGFGAAISFLTGFPIKGISWLSVPLSAFIMSLCATLAIYILGKAKGMDAKTMVLFGIVVNFFFQALQSLVQFRATPEVAQQIVFWMFGSLLKSTWTGVFISGGVFLVCAILLTRYAWRLTALCAGEERARSLGINTDKLRLRVFIISALLTAGAVAFIGTIGFIGLVAPHFGRMLVGEDQRYLAPLSALFGVLLMLVASIIAKVVIPGAIVPIGIVTSLVGVPFLLYLILKRSEVK
ncbi:FecCD family ABC transporter permease [Tepidibacter thalassicus]|uniref:Iron complex transport system permease protein n=1 Tax=Tepidibacter thalassicus DSM 15285 TaxID=1123350 RepID=A0A1M5QQS4_9FIRM|nr:iron ABC transporter permease [Tepidibacter thalassicus]SHH16455.1 iron complex transport system permease protein [Tepidibacter thalassicus DSM 15285]